MNNDDLKFQLRQAIRRIENIEVEVSLLERENDILLRRNIDLKCELSQLKKFKSAE